MAEPSQQPIALPALRPSVSAQEIFDLLKAQKGKGEQLLEKAFLSIEDVRNWNLFTKKILSKGFGPSWDYIHSILYAGDQKPYSAYEPESTLELKRKRNFETSLRMLQRCMDELMPASATQKHSEPQPGNGAQVDLAKQLEALMPLNPLPPAPALPQAPPPPIPAGTCEDQPRSEGRKKMEEIRRNPESPKVLLLCGRDGEKKAAVIDFLKNLDLEPVIPGPAQEGNIVNLFRDEENFAFALALLEAEEIGHTKGEPAPGKPRPAQKTIFELGILMGRLQPNLVCALYEAGLDIPSEYKGDAFVLLDSGGLWKLIVARAMKMAEVDVDLNKAI